MNVKLGQASPSHKLCFRHTDRFSNVYGSSNIADVELGGNGEEIPNIESYDWRNLAALFGSNVSIFLPEVLRIAVERDREMHRHYGLPEINPVFFDAREGFNSDILALLGSGTIDLNDSYIMTFEDNHDFIRIAQENGLTTANRSADIVLRLNDKVEMLTTGEIEGCDNVSVPNGFEVKDMSRIEQDLVRLSEQLRFSDSFLAIKTAYSASGQGIKKGNLNDLLEALKREDSEISRWIRFNQTKPGQRFMVQEYYSQDRFMSSPACQISVDDDGANLLAVNKQILLDDVHQGNMFYPGILENSPNLNRSIESIMQFLYNSGFRGVIGVDLLEFANENGQKEFAFMEFNARWTGAVTPILISSAITGQPATQLYFSSDNTFKTGNISFETLRDVINTYEFDPMYDGNGVVLVSSAPMITCGYEDPKAQLLFMGDSTDKVVEVKRNFTTTLRGY